MTKIAIVLVCWTMLGCATNQTSPNDESNQQRATTSVKPEGTSSVVASAPKPAVKSELTTSTAPVEPQVEPTKVFRESCTSNAECKSQMCVGNEQKMCAKRCDNDCPTGWYCQRYEGTLFYCLPRCEGVFTLTVLKADGVTPQPGARVESTVNPTLSGITDQKGQVSLPIEGKRYVAKLFNKAVTEAFDVAASCGELTVKLRQELRDGIRLAVVYGEYDSVQDILAQMGFTPGKNLDLYHHEYTPKRTGANFNATKPETWPSYYYLFHREDDRTLDPALLKRYDGIFFNCGNHQGDETVVDSDDGEYPKPTGLAADSAALQNLRKFVENGGFLYASDWAHLFVETLWPSMIDFAGDDRQFDDSKIGSDGIVKGAAIKDPQVRDALGRKTVRINFDLDDWVVIDAVPSNAKIIIYGSPPTTNGGQDVAGRPLMVSYKRGKGTVLFTSFHNEKQATGDMVKILKLVLSSAE